MNKVTQPSVLLTVNSISRNRKGKTRQNSRLHENLIIIRPVEKLKLFPQGEVMSVAHGLDCLPFSVSDT